MDTATGQVLVDSMTNEVVVRDQSIRGPIPFDPMPYNDPVRKALAERAREVSADDRRPPEPVVGTHRVRAAGSPAPTAARQ